jgi:primary-amine oxidase
MRKRGISDFGKVQIDPWTAGYHGAPEDDGRRSVRGISSYRGDARSAYMRPIEGVVAYVDLTAGKVFKLVDTGVRPLPKNTDLNSQPRHLLKPLAISQPQGASFRLSGHEVSWSNWRFRYAVHPREGLVLYTAGFDDHGKQRSILHRASLAEMVVPYGDPDAAWYFRNVFDTGEYAFVGRSITPQEPGTDAPLNAVFQNAVFAGEDGKPYESPRAVAIYERDGGLLWRYTDLSTSKSESRRARELVVSYIMTAGNYEYGFNWVFHQDGVLELELLLTGIMSAKGVDAGSHGSHGHLVAENVAAVHHQHFFNFRLDLDVDGASNSVAEMNTAASPDRAADPFHKAIVMTETIFRSEREGVRSLDLASSRKWKVFNPGRRNALGDPAGYVLVPGENSVPYAAPDSWIRRRAGFLNAHLWVTRYDPAETNAAGTYINQSKGGEGLPKWIAANRPLMDQDVVLWYTLGVTHIPRPEDWPVMPVHHAGFKLIPSGFFSRNPAMD